MYDGGVWVEVVKENELVIIYLYGYFLIYRNLGKIYFNM